MEENRRLFGHMPDGTPAEEITLGQGGMRCKILTYGGAVRSLAVPDRDGNPVDVVLGFDTLEDYMAQDKYIGALVGRYANRIGGAKFTLNGAEYPLFANDGPNSLHGGRRGFDKRLWTVEELSENAVTLSLVSPHMEEGYPGTLRVRVTYALERLPHGVGALSIKYRAVCDRDTVFNPTSHTYFNLSGHGSGSVEGQYIRLFADGYTPIGAGLIPTGETAPVEGTPMDLREWRRIGEHIDDPFEQLTLAGGYDHNWILLPDRSTPAAAARSEDTGIAMTVHTDMRGIQFYAGNYLDGCPRGKGGAAYGKRSGFCLETQFFPDSPNRPEFPSCVLRAGAEFTSRTSYHFYTQDSDGGPQSGLGTR